MHRGYRQKASAALADGPLHLRFDASTHPDPAERVEAWRDAFAASVDVAFAPREVADFAAGADFYELGPALLADTRYTNHRVVRDKRTIERTGGEQVILDVFVEGGIVGQVGGRSCRAKAGDCFVMDMRGSFRLRLSRGRFIGFIMPRDLFDGATAGSARVHGLVLPAGSPKATLLGALLTSLVDTAPELSPTQAEAIGRAAVGLVAACLIEADGAASKPRSREAQSSSESQPDPTAVRLRRHIERHAADPAYDPDTLARAFGLSRSTVYRLFRRRGGVAEVIRRRRADLARRALAKERGTRPRLAEIAAASGWSDVRAMKRALRAFFDATPEELCGRKAEPDPGSGDAGVKVGALFDDRPR